MPSPWAVYTMVAHLRGLWVSNGAAHVEAAWPHAVGAEELPSVEVLGSLDCACVCSISGGGGARSQLQTSAAPNKPK